MRLPRLAQRAAQFALVGLLVASVAVLTPAPSAGQPDSKSEPKSKPVPLEKCLPCLLEKALLDNEREHVDTLAVLFKRAKGLLEGDLVSPLSVKLVEADVLQARVRLLRQQKDYDDALDQLQLRFEVKPARLKELEDSVTVPLTGHFGRFSKVYEDEQAAVVEASKFIPLEKAPVLRADLLCLAQTSRFVKGTMFAKQITGRLEKWQKLSDKELKDRADALQDEQKKLLDKQAELQADGKHLSPAEEARLKEVGSEYDAGYYESLLRQYEGKYVENGKPKKPAAAAERRRVSDFRDVFYTFQKVMVAARNERIGALRKSWPELPPIEVDKTRLLTCDWDKAERVLAIRLKKPSEFTVAKARLRNVRMLAETYRIQQRLFEISFDYIGSALEEPPPTPPGFPEGSSRVEKLNELRGAESSLTQVKGQLLSTWFDYQIARFDLFVDLGLPSP